MFEIEDNSREHESIMGNSFPTNAELEDSEIKTFLSVYDYVIPLVGVLIVLVNSIVVVSSGLIIKRGVEPRFTYIFLGNVALTDTITGLSILFGQYFPHEYRNHQVCTIQIGMIVSSSLSSIYSVGLLAIDRFLYIVYGLKYCKWISISRVKLVVTLTWIMAITIGFLPFLGWSGDTTDGRVCWFITAAPRTLILIAVSIGILPIILVVILYSIILYHAMKNIKKIRYSLHTINTISQKIASMENLRMFKGNIELPIKRYMPRRKTSNSQIPQKWKAVKVVLFTTFAFLFTWAPFFIACVMYISQCDVDARTEFCSSLKLLITSPLTLLGFTNSLINPVIYAWWHNGFRSYVKQRIKMCCR